MDSTTHMILQNMLGGDAKPKAPVEPTADIFEKLRGFLDTVWEEPGTTKSSTAQNSVLLKARNLNLVIVIDAGAMSTDNKTEEQRYSMKLFAFLSATIGLLATAEESIANGDESKKIVKQHAKIAKQLDEIIETIDKLSQSIVVYIL